MKKTLLFFCFLVYTWSLDGQIINGRFTTSFYTFEKYESPKFSESHLLAYQTAQFDITKNNISVSTLLQGSKNFPDVGNFSAVRMYNLFFKWRNIADIADLTLGRHSVFAGVGNGLIDGGTIKLKFFDKAISITGYAGANVKENLETEIASNRKDNYMVGGQLVTTIFSDLRVGLSYYNRHRERVSYKTLRADSLGLPFYRIIELDSPAEQYASADVNYFHNRLGRIYGRFDYDLNFEKNSRIQFGGRANLTSSISLTGDYIYRVPRIAYNSIFHVFNYGNTTEIEGGIEYAYQPTLRLFGKFANIEYSGDKSQRYTFGMNAEYGSLVYSGNTGYAGELNALSAQIYYPLFDRILIPTIAFSRSSYKLTKQSERMESFTGLLGATVKTSQSFSFDTQIQWLNNKIYKNDFRLLVKFNYLFSHQLNIL